MREQRLAESRSARFGAHEQIFEIDAGASLEGREIVEEERKALRRAVDLANHDLGIGARAEEIFAELRFVEADFVRELFIIGEIADELGDQRKVGGGRRADGESHAMILY